MSNEGLAHHNKQLVGDISERENRIQRLRSLVNESGGIAKHALKIGMNRSVISAMLCGYTRVSDRALMLI